MDAIERRWYRSGSAARSASASAQRDLRGHVAGERVVRGGLVGDDVEPLAGRRPGGLDLRGVADERDRQRLPLGRPRPRRRERLRGVVGEPVDVADVEPPSRPRLVDLDRDAGALVHRHGQRLRAAHPAQAGGQRHGPPQAAAEVLARELGERLVGALEDPLGADVDPGAGRHLAVHRQAFALELAERVPGRPACRRGSSSRSARAAPTRGSGTPRRACPTGRGASRRRRAGGARGRSRRRPPSCAPPGRSRRRRRGGRGPPRPRDRGCS